MKPCKIAIAIFCIGLCLSTFRGNAQCLPFTYSSLDGNKVNASLHNSGDMFWDLTANAGYEVPKGSGRHASFANALWVGGLDPMGGLHVAAATYRQSGNDFFAGPYRTNSQYQCGRGIQTPAACFNDGILWHSSGKIIHLFSQGFQIYDPQTQGTVLRYFASTYSGTKAVELANGDVVILAWGPGLQAVSEAIVLTATNNFAIGTLDTLLYNQLEATITVLPTGKLLIAGPVGVEAFDPTTHVSVPKTNRNHPSYRHDAVLLPNGKILMTSFGVASTELYDPITDMWQVGPTLAQTRTNYPQLTLLPSGNVLISGGTMNTSTTEIYNPQANSISAGPVLPEAFMQHSAHLIGNDHVVFVYHQTNSTPVRPIKLNLNSGNASFLPFNDLKLPSGSQAGQMLVQSGDPTNFLFLDPLAEKIVDQRWQHIWKVSRAQVQQFQTDFANGTVNFANYPDIETWPGNGNVWAGEDAQLAPYIDTNNDGVYDPLNAGDYPCFLGDQALWWVFNDDGPHTETQSTAFPLQVEVMAYSFDCQSSVCPDTALDYTTFYHYEITNKGLQPYHDLYLGMWRDTDIGYFFDDYVGCDTTLGIAFGFNGDANDETASGYGLNPPALGSLVLPNGDIDVMNGMMVYDNDFTVRGNPETTQHFYGYLQSLWKDGSVVLQNGVGPAQQFMYPGDPGWCAQGGGNGGWSLVDGNNQPYDHRFLQSFGPLTIQSGASVELDLALIYSRGNYNDNLGSVCELLDDATILKNWWQNTANQGCFNISVAAPESQRENVNGIKVFPNPNSGSFWLELETAAKEDLSLSIVNLHGQIVLQTEMQRGQDRHFVADTDLPNGIYLLQLQGKTTQATVKVVVQ